MYSGKPACCGNCQHYYQSPWVIVPIGETATHCRLHSATKIERNDVNPYTVSVSGHAFSPPPEFYCSDHRAFP